MNQAIKETKAVTAKKSNAGRKPLPEGAKRKMYSTRLHPKVIQKLKDLRKQKGKPVARIIEDLVNMEYKSIK